MLLAELVAVADAVAATSSRTAKIAMLADALRKLDGSEIDAAAGFLIGQPRQGRVGVGWATLFRFEVAPAASPSLTIGDLDTALDQILGATGKGSAQRRAAILTALLARATDAEIGFVRRVLTGELRHGALAGIVTDAIAKAAGVPAETVRRAAMLGGDLPRTARLAIEEGAPALETVGLRVLNPVLPMLASTAEDVTEALSATAPASVEWKLDGIRIQVHRSNDEIRVFTRNLNDITARLPEVAAIASGLPARSFVLDAEAIVLGADERPHLFQETMSRAGRRRVDAEAALVPWFFDALHIDGKDMIDRPLGERIDALGTIAGRWRIPFTLTSDPDAAKKVLDESLAAGHEGVMVKALSSTYLAGRRGKAWRKVKPAPTLDLVVLGAEWGHGRRQGWLSNLHLGARDPGGGFLMVGKTFKGLTDETLRWQTERLQQIETSRSGIVVYVRPELVVEIELDSAQISRRYPGGVALRFARVKRYRPDKSAEDADTIDAVRALVPHER